MTPVRSEPPPGRVRAHAPPVCSPAPRPHTAGARVRPRIPRAPASEANDDPAPAFGFEIFDERHAGLDHRRRHRFENETCDQIVQRSSLQRLTERERRSCSSWRNVHDRHTVLVASKDLFADQAAAAPDNGPSRRRTRRIRSAFRVRLRVARPPPDRACLKRRRRSDSWRPRGRRSRRIPGRWRRSQSRGR